ncbi:MAG: hypothetical protein H0U23_14965 [Blastocatellia bacterium]|nr:hypothetical protein [Blastocatellia bacterium]
MSNDKTYTPNQVAGLLAKAIQEKIDGYAADFQELRKREVKKTSKLVKSQDLCALCGNADAPGSCTCIGQKLGKSAGSVPKTPGLQPVKPAGVAPPAASAPCTGCGKPHPMGKCMGKSDMSPNVVAEPGAKLPPKKLKVAEASKGSGGEVVKGKLSKAGEDIGNAKTILSPAPKKTLHGIGAVPGGVGAIAPAAGKTVLPLKDLMASAGARSAKTKMASPGLPGMTGGIHPEVLQDLHTAKLTGGMGVALNGAGAPRSFVKKPGADTAVAAAPAPSIATTPTAAPKPEAATMAPNRFARPAVGGSAKVGDDLAADKKAAGMGFFNNLFAKLKGTGNKTWGDLTGTGRKNGSMGASMAALARNESASVGSPLVKAEFLGNCVLCNCVEHRGSC